MVPDSDTPECRACPSDNRPAIPIGAAVTTLFLLLLGGRFKTFLLDPDLALLTVLFLAALAVGGLYLVAAGRVATRLAAGLLAVGLWAAVGALFALSHRVAAEALLWWLLYLGIACLGLWAGGERPRREATLKGLTVGVAGVAVVGVAQMFSWLPVEALHYTESWVLRITSTLNHPNNLAGFIALTLPVVLGQAVAARSQSRGRAAVVFGVLAAALLWCAARTYSRGGQAAVLVGVAVFVAALPRGGPVAWLRRDRRRVALVLGGVVLLLVAIGVTGLGSRVRLLIELLPTLPQFRRWGTWAAALRMLVGHPATGVGPGCFWLAFPGAKPPGAHFELYTHAHNWYLQVADEGGAPLLAGLLTVLYLACRQTVAGWRRVTDGAERAVLVGLFAGLIGFAAAGLLDYNVGVPSIGVTFWFLLGLAGGSGGRGRSPVAVRTAAGFSVVLLLALLGPWLVWNRGQAAYQVFLGALSRGDGEAPAHWLDRARALDPGQRAYDLAAADLAIWAGDDDRAVEVLTRLLEHGPPLDSHYRARLAWLVLEQGRPERAAAILEQAIAADPCEPVLRVDAGVMALRRGKTAIARRRFEEAVAMHDDATGGYAGLGDLALAAGDRADAAELFARGAVTGDPRDRVPRFVIAYGRVDPLAVVPPNRRAGALTDRVRYHGPVLPRLRLRWMEVRARAGTRPH